MRKFEAGQPGDFCLPRTAASKLPTGNFACRDQTGGAKALFAGKIPVSRPAAKCRPSFWPARGFFPRECRRHSGWLPGIRQKRCCRLIGRHTCARSLRRSLAAKEIVHPVHGCLRPRPLTRAPEGQAYVPAVHPPKRPFSRRQAKNAGGVFRRHRFGWAKIRFSSYSRSAQGRFLR